jgi:glycosyltransferase involved in cell wall biosynthesis
VPKGDKAVLADRLMRLLVDATLRKQMGRAGRTIYERDFAFAVMYQRTLKIYTDLLARKVAQQC